jgi:transglutaminase-like putative cysteine protease
MLDDRERDFLKSDEEKRKRIEAAGAKEDHEGADAVVVVDHTWGDVEVSGLGNLYNNRIVKLLTEKGCAQYSVIRFDYDPRSYINDVLKLRIHRKDGEVEELDPGDFRDVMQPEHSLYWRVKMKLYNLPHLEVGDAVEWETFKKGFNVAYLRSGPAGEGATEVIDPDTWVDPKTGIKPPMYGAFYDIVYFREKIPIKEKRYTLLCPRDMPLSYEMSNGTVRPYCLVDDEYFSYSWEARDVEGYKPEERMPAPEVALPKLLVSTIHDWREKSRWFYRVNESQFGWNDEIKAVVDRVTAPWETDEEKVTALLHWVAQEIRYIGFSICQGEGYTLHPGEMTFRERGGVCKDYAGMLVTMLRAAGYEAYAAQTTALVPPDRIPADQFNHCVAAWRRPDGSWRLLDPTWAPYSMDVWDTAETKQSYLIGSPEGEEIAETPLVKPEDSLLEVRARSRITEEGDLEGHVDYEGVGRSDTTQRFLRVWQPAVEFPRTIQKMMATIDPAVEVLAHTYGDVQDLYKSYDNHLDYRVRGYAVRGSGELQFRIPMARFLRATNIARYLTAAKEEERKFDLFVIFLQKVVVEEEIELPAGYRLVSRNVRAHVETEAADLDACLSECDGGLRFRAEFVLKVRTVTTKQYKAFRELTEKAKELAERWLILRRDDEAGCV